MKFIHDDKTICTFSNKGILNFIKIQDDTYIISNTMNTSNDEDMDMYESDTEDAEYVRSLEMHGYHSIDSNDSCLSYTKFQSTESFCYQFDTQEVFKTIKFDKKDLHVIFTKLMSNNRLLVCYDSNKFLIHDLDKKSLTKFSKQNLKKFPINYLTRYNRIYGCFELSESKFVLYTHFNYILIDTESKVPEYCKIIPSIQPKSDTKTMDWNKTVSYYHKKYISALQNSYIKPNIEDAKDNTSDNFKIDSRFKGILYMGKINTQSDQLIVIENLWKNLVDKLPDVLKVHKFGQ